MIKNKFLVALQKLGALIALAFTLLLLAGCYEPAITPTSPSATNTPATSTALASSTPTLTPNPPIPTPTTLAPQATPTTTPVVNSFSEVDSYIRDLMVRYDIPGAAIGLVKDGKVILTRGYGVRNIDTGAPVTENTQFPIGSLTKSFTSLAIMQLVDQGKLNLDTPAIKYLPELKLSDPEATQKVTLRQLLSHTSGLPRQDEGLFQVKDRQKVLSGIEKIKLTAKPGETWQYSNQGYVILGAIIERASGQSWGNYIRQSILMPLNMSSATLDLASLKQSPDYAVPHVLLTYVNQEEVARFADPQGVAAACAINASVSDMAEYLRFQLGDGSLTDQKGLVSTGSFSQMHNSQIKLPDYFGYQNRGYALGWYTGEYRGNKILTHDGTVGDFYANALLAPEAKAGVIILTNTSYNAATEVFSQAVSQGMLDYMTGLKLDPTLAEKLNRQASGDLPQRQANIDTSRTYKADPTTFDRLLGSYNGSNNNVNVTTHDGKLYLNVTQIYNQGNAIYELVPYKPNGFIATNLGIYRQTFEFKTEPIGNITIFLEGFILASRPNQDYLLGNYQDPHSHFSLAIPQNVQALRQDDTGVIIFQNPEGKYIFGALETGAGNLTTSTAKIVMQLVPYSPPSPISMQNLSLSAGQNWAQFHYQPFSYQQLTVLVQQRKGVSYFVALEARPTDFPALTPMLNELLAAFKIND